ncbi:hypothetical protein HAX54_037829 [Datura stramonium]|uniref:Uncharacterized protein n=1 Tax=Datura stramonium TaxID=4076 RepID=A0ABS8SHJ1_DATST|nr:hypothetical protein [Datura stramonium]
MASSSNSPFLVGRTSTHTPHPFENSPISETIPGSSYKAPSPTQVPPSYENSNDNIPIDNICEEGERNLGKTKGKAAAEKFGQNEEALPTIGDTFESKNDEEEYNLSLSLKWERPKTLKTTLARKHIIMKTSPPKRPRTRGALRRLVERKKEMSKRKIQDSKKDARKRKIPNIVELDDCSDEVHSPSESIPALEEHAPTSSKRNRT